MSYAPIVHPTDAETPVESLKIHVHVKPQGYMRETLEAAKRLPDRHVVPGHAYLVPQVTL